MSAMRRFASLALIAVATLASGPTFGHPDWRLVVEDGEAAVRYPVMGHAVVIGSGDQVDIRLDGLAPRHAVIGDFAAAGEESTVETSEDEASNDDAAEDDAPKGDEPTHVILALTSTQAGISVGDGPKVGYASFDKDDALTVGRYRLHAVRDVDCDTHPQCRRATDRDLLSDGPNALRFEVALWEDDELIFSRVVPEGTYRFGNSADADFQRPGLEEDHAVVALSPQHMIIEPHEGTVLFDKSPLRSAQTVNFADTFIIGGLEVSVRPITNFTPETAAVFAAGARAEELSQDQYKFCHDETFGQNDRRVPAHLCKLLDNTTADACPAAHRSCPWGRVEATKAWLPRIALPAGLLRALLFLVLAAGIIWFIVVLVRGSFDDEFRPEALSVEPATLDVQKLPEARSQALLRRAKSALDGGDALQAAVLAHLAILRHLDDSGLARYHPSKTNGDYLRAIRKHKPLQQLFRLVSRQTERVRFGDGQVDASAVAEAVHSAPDVLRADPVRSADDPGATPATLTGLILVLSFSQADCTGLTGRPYHAHGPEGMAALPALLKAADLNPEIGRWKWDDLPEDTGVVVLRTSAAAFGRWPSALKLDEVLDNVSVVIIDDTLTSPSMLSDTRYRGFAMAPRARSYAGPSAPGLCVPESLLSMSDRPVTLLNRGALEVKPVNRVVTSSISDLPLQMVPLLGAVDTSSSGGTAMLWGAARRGLTNPTCVYILQGRTLFTNASLSRPENAAFVAALFSSLARSNRTVALLDRLDSRMDSISANDRTSAGQAFVASNMLPFLLQSLAFLVVVLFAVGAAFGPLRDSVVRTHKEFVEHVEALGMHYARSGHRGLTHSAHALARLVVMQSRDKVRSTTTGGWRALVNDLAEKYDLPEDDVLAALRLGVEGTSELGTPLPSDPPPHSDRVLRTLSRLVSGRDAGRHLAQKKPTYRGSDHDETP